MRKARVLVVDDSVVARRFLTDALSSDPAIEVVDAAATGRVALAKIPYVNPDLVTLDVDMPEMTGLETLAFLRKDYPALPVIMVSNLTEHGAVATLDALSLGANDYVTKPSNVKNRDAALQQLREALIPKIKTFCPAAATGDPALSASFLRAFPPAQPSDVFLPDARRVDVVAIGVSTGGPNALADLLPQLPKDLPVPVLIVQHMPPIFTRFLSDRLSTKSGLAVSEGVPGDKVEPGRVFIAPGDHHMLVEREGGEVRLRINRDTPENSCRPSVDVLFRSAAKAYQSHVLAVIMTGMGQDGLRGCERVRELGGQILAQDEASSVVWGMPGFVVKAGLADRVLPLNQMAGEIARRIRLDRTPPASVKAEG